MLHYRSAYVNARKLVLVPESLRNFPAKIYVNYQGFSNKASDWLGSSHHAIESHVRKSLLINMEFETNLQSFSDVSSGVFDSLAVGWQNPETVKRHYEAYEWPGVPPAQIWHVTHHSKTNMGQTLTFYLNRTPELGKNITLHTYIYDLILNNTGNHSLLPP